MAEQHPILELVATAIQKSKYSNGRSKARQQDPRPEDYRYATASIRAFGEIIREQISEETSPTRKKALQDLVDRISI